MNRHTLHRFVSGWLVALLLAAGTAVLAPTAVRADAIDTMAELLDAASSAHVNPYASQGLTGDSLRASRGLIEELSKGSDPILALAKYKDTPIGQKIMSEGDLPSWVDDLLDLYVAIVHDDFWGIVENLGQAAVCIVAQVILGGVDLCGALEDLYEFAKSAYASAKDFWEDVKSFVEGLEEAWNTIVDCLGGGDDWPKAAFSCVPTHGSLKSSDFADVRNTYLFAGWCGASMGNQAGVVSYTIQGLWNGRTALEMIRLKCNVPVWFLSGGKEIHLSAACQRDPWLYDDAGVTDLKINLTSIDQFLFGGWAFPRSRALLPAAQQAASRDKATARDWRVMTPHIYSPAPGAIIDGTAHTPEVFVKISTPQIVDPAISDKLFTEAYGQITVYPLGPSGKPDAFPADGRAPVTADHLPVIGVAMFKRAFNKLPPGKWLARAWLRSSNLVNQSNEVPFEVKGAGAEIKAPAAPVIVTPAQGQWFPLPANIALQIQHTSGYPVELQAKHSPFFEKPARGPDVASVSPLVPAYASDIASTMTGVFQVSAPGRWWIRARSKFAYGEAPWSEWRAVIAGGQSPHNPQVERTPAARRPGRHRTR